MLKSKRMACIVGAVKKCKCVADVGCDHGFVSVELVETGKVKKVIASDISCNSLLKAKKYFSTKHLSGTIDFVQSNGVSHLIPGETDVIIFAGMGGLLIADIIDKGKDVCKSSELVICPHSKADSLRSYLASNGFTITSEKFVSEEGKYYPVINAVYRCEKCEKNVFDLFLGENSVVIKDDDYRMFLEWYSNLLLKQIADIEKSMNNNDGILVFKRALLSEIKRRLMCL